MQAEGSEVDSFVCLFVLLWVCLRYQNIVMIEKNKGEKQKNKV